MTSSTFPATKLRSTQRIDLAIAAMAGSANIRNVAAEHQVSRKFIYQQKDKARIAPGKPLSGRTNLAMAMCFTSCISARVWPTYLAVWLKVPLPGARPWI